MSGVAMHKHQIMVMHLKHSWSHDDATLHLRKKKENISKNYTAHMNLEEQFSCQYEHMQIRS